MPTIKLSNSVVAKLPHPASGQVIYYSDSVRGLGVRVTPTAKTYIAENWRERKKARFTLGLASQITLDIARAKATEIFAKLNRGDDPREEKRKNAIESKTLRELFEEYLAHSDLKARTIYDYRRLMYGVTPRSTGEPALTGYLSPWLDLPFLKINREMVGNLHAQIGARSPAQANYAMRLLRCLFYYGMDHYRNIDGQPFVHDNPVRALRKGWYKIGRKQSLVRVHQLKPWFNAILCLDNNAPNAKGDTMRDLLITIVLTGLRRGEATRLTWSDIDLDGRILTVRDTKNRDVHSLPLGNYLLSLLEMRRERHAPKKETERVFDVVEPKRAIENVHRSCGIKFSIHDLRRSFSTFAESLDVPHYTLKRLLNHRVKDVTGGYVQIDLERLREPMQRIENFILTNAGVMYRTSRQQVGKTLRMSKKIQHLR